MENKWETEISSIEYTITKGSTGRYNISFFNLSAWEGASATYVKREDLVKLRNFIQKVLDESKEI
jgi:hypothetical protein